MRRFAVLFAVMTLLSLSAAKDEFQASDFAKQQLNSIGSEQARGAVKNRVILGPMTFQWLNVAGTTQGQFQFASEGNKLVSVLKLPSPDYHGEQFTYDGKKTDVKPIQPGIWSALGRFVLEHPEVLKEGLWGGTLSTAWALGHLDERHAKLEDRGLKNIDGRQLHRVDYFPKKNSDLQIELYFEPETSRHVMTVYSYHVQARAGGGPFASAGQEERYYRLEERFADFKTVDDLALPTRWTIQYSGDPSQTAVGALADGYTRQQSGNPSQARTSAISQFEISDPKISQNMSLDPRNFEIK